jgi:hypothetical protein
MGNEFGVIPGHEANVAAARKAMKAAKGRGLGVGGEGEPTPRRGPGVPGMGRLGQAEVVGLADFAKKIQLASMGGGRLFGFVVLGMVGAFPFGA